LSYLLTVAETCGLNILLALSVYATFMVGQFSLAQVGFWSIGAYTTGILVAMYGIPLLAALLTAALLCAFIGLLVGYPCLRIRGIYLAMATVAFSEVVRVFFNNFVLQIPVGSLMLGPGGPLGFRGIPVLTRWPQIATAVLFFLVLFAWLERSRIGLAAKAIREDEIAAACSGINVVAMKVGMFAFGAAVAAIGGGMYGTYVSSVTPDNFGFHLALISVFFVAVGGSNRYVGPVIGAIVLTVLPDLLRFAGDYRMVLYGVIVLAITVTFPRGIDGIWPTLAGRWRRSKTPTVPRVVGGA
jgi:branched-chain amino acid transport system permease protein